MKTTTINLSVLGVRGSMPIEGKAFELYGGATTCFKIQAGNEEIYLDAGSGIVNAKPLPDSRITILLTHMHLDHIVGLPFFSALAQKNRPIDIYAQERSGLNTQAAIDKLISPPFWPLTVGAYPANINFLALPKNSFSIGAVKIDFMEGNHPQGSTIYRLTCAGKSLVCATDFEHTAESCAALADFAKDCDLLLYDAQYLETEYDKYRGYGHSTPTAGLAVADKARAKKILFVHHDPRRDDESLKTMEREAVKLNENAAFAKIGEEIFL